MRPFAVFKNREDAGRRLGESLLRFKNQNPLILAIPRGGVPIGYEVAKILKAPLDLIMVKKIGAPLNPEFAIGAVSEDSKPLLNHAVIQTYHFNRHEIEKTAQQKIAEVREQIQKLRGNKKPELIEKRVIILVDDGIATGATLFAAIQFLRTKKPAKIIVAAPVAARDTVYELQAMADDVVCLETTDDLIAVGMWYEFFNQVSDQEVIQQLKEIHFLKSHGLSDEITIKDGMITLSGILTPVENAKALVIFAHGSGSSRHSPRNQYVARELNKRHFSTLLFDLLTDEEASERRYVFDIELLAQRLMKATDWAVDHFKKTPLPIAYFGASTGAGAALIAAAKTRHPIYTVVSRGGRPDLAMDYLEQVEAPTLLIVGGNDFEVIKLNELAKKKLGSCKLVLVANATHVFEEPGALEEVAELAMDWLEEQLPHKAKQSKKSHISHSSRKLDLGR
ncbi:alpha/beta family hydrolase [Bdellovibrio svalbardensis]|uniref:Phosphoribosyltransferase family protein n=1 Tax=Bdellovibrio svalbardensis TaxID=2972972 RepID=A0ABT6DLL4_9BACT|nr:alpha/beta family hydrolase [Bdellovibrio svalbardensis]MDG0817479.1 phosphoribosyltransferase family protein [Bdellovibrio svalbardensis]